MTWSYQRDHIKNLEYYHNTIFRYVTKALMSWKHWEATTKFDILLCLLVSSWLLTIGFIYYPDDVTLDDISSGWIMTNGVCHLDDITKSERQIIWMTPFLLVSYPDDLWRMKYITGWYTMLLEVNWMTLWHFVYHPDDLAPGGISPQWLMYYVNRMPYDAPISHSDDLAKIEH